MRELVLVHGRAQEHKDSVALKKEWLDTFREGLGKSGLELPIPEDRVRFPYYGQTLFDLVAGVALDKVAEVVVRGSEEDPQLREFMMDVLDEVLTRKGITDEEVQAEAEAITRGGVIERGPLNWKWVQGVLSAIDRHVPGGSGASIALFTKDVYQYLTNPGLRDVIEAGVRQAMTPGVESVVVSHSLGTVVSYNLLRREGKALGWKVPLYVTVGSPLAISKIRKSLAPNKHPACVGKWFNAMDPDDVVALYPLDERHFPVDPAIENKKDVKNQTSNQHGIAGYLNDKDVAKRIYDALIA
ncbi:MAG TPA: alpha/beta hydrolase [Thermoanaerobaculia bacterium]|nr:alpha/beta hydrolase [Thermoanaerobaculia bacterium]